MKRKLVMLATAMMILALAAPAVAEKISYFPTGNVKSVPPGPTYFAFDITPFDSIFYGGSLNSVTMSMEVNVSGSAELWSSDPNATLTFNFTNTLDAVPEMGWGPTVASFAGIADYNSPNAYYLDF